MICQYERSGHSCFGGRNRCFGGEGFLEDIEMMRKDFREIAMSDVVCKTSTGFSFYDVVGSFTRMAFMSLKQSDVVLNTARMEPMGLPRNGHCCSKIRLLKSIQICCGCKVVKGCGVNFGGIQGGKWFRCSNFANFNGRLFVFVPSNLSHLGHPDHYPSSHTHGSEQWFPPIVLTFRIEPFSTSMIIRRKSQLVALFFSRLDSAVGLFPKDLGRGE